MFTFMLYLKIVVWLGMAALTTFLYNRHIEDTSYGDNVSGGHTFLVNAFFWPIFLGQFAGEYAKIKRSNELEARKREDKRIALEMKLAEAEFKRLGI